MNYERIGGELAEWLLKVSKANYYLFTPELNEYLFSAARDGEYHDKNKVHSQAWMLGPASLVYDWPVLVAAL